MYLDLFCFNYAENQKALVEYVYDSCDLISFNVPSFHHSKSNTQSIALKDDGNRDEDFIIQNENTLTLIRECNMKIVGTSVKSEYGDSKYSYMLQVYYVTPTPEFKALLMNNYFRDWIAPDFPEDVILYKGNNPRLVTVSHEELVSLKMANVEDMAFMIGEKIQFSRVEE